MAERPYTLLSCSMSIDGYIDGASESRLLLSNELDLDRVDRVRAGVDAILVGATTVRNDNPRLLVRDPGLRRQRCERGLPEHPTKVTVTEGGCLDPSSRFFADDGAAKVVYGSSRWSTSSGTGWGAGPRSWTPATRSACVSSSEDLHARGVRRLMVEGGGAVHTQFLADDLADELQLVVAPFFVGETGARRFVGEASFPWHPGHRARLASTEQLGDVVLLRYALSGRYDAGASGSP